MKFKPVVFILFLLLFNPLTAYTQTLQSKGGKTGDYDPNKEQGIDGESSEKKSKQKVGEKADYRLYKKFFIDGDSIYVDTTLTLDTDYRLNWTRKDKFGFMEFSNQGKTYTPLYYDVLGQSTRPDLGVPAKQFNYITKEETPYYSVATPTSNATYRTGIKQGQFLDVFFTSNFSENFNAMVAFKGMRSLGTYRNNLTSHENFRFSSNYLSDNKRYNLHFHYVFQNLYNQENGGLTSESVDLFTSDDPQYNNRGLLETNLDDAFSKLDGKRLFLDQSYSFVKKEKDSISHALEDMSLRLSTNYEWKKFIFDQESIAPDNIFGESYTDEIRDVSWLNTWDNTLALDFTSPYLLGDFTLFSQMTNFDYRFEKVTVTEQGFIPASIDGYLWTAGADWHAKIGKWNLEARVETKIAGDLDAQNAMAKTYVLLDSLTSFGGGIRLLNQSPDYNFQLYQSDLKNFNWYNPNLKSENSQSLFAYLRSKWINLSANYDQIDNYTYFENNTNPSVEQLSNQTVRYFKAELENELPFGKWALRNRVMYQEVLDGQQAFRVPTWTTRNTIYYSSYMFKGNPLYLQTGVTFSYFSSFYADAFNPVLGNYAVQNDTQIGDYPVFDYFLNFQVRRTNFFFKIENFTSSFGGHNYFSNPLYPYRDWRFRFGISWTWFN